MGERVSACHPAPSATVPIGRRTILIMQRYCPVCHKLIDMRRFSDATRPSDVADPWHFERHAREDYSGGTATQRVWPGSDKNEHDARDTW